MTQFRYIVLWINLGLVATLLVWSVCQKESVLKTGRVVNLQLAPIDPRSLMQGDYQTLAYDFARKMWSEDSHLPRNGFVVMKLDDRNVGTFARLDTKLPTAAADEVAIIFRHRKFGARIGAESFFFQEGTGQRYSKARFAELRVSAGGEALVTALLDEELKPLGPAH